MKLRIRHFTTSLTFIVILVAGCGGCGQETVQDIEVPSETTPQVVGEDIANRDFEGEGDQFTTSNMEVVSDLDKRSPLIFQAPQGYALYPFARPVIASDVRKRANAEVNRRLAALEKAGDYTELEYEETIRKGADVIYEEVLGTLAYAQHYCHERRPYRAYPFAVKALAENPNDFETLLTWVYTYPHNREADNHYNDEARVDALRRLNGMNPDHPYVLQELARAIYPERAEEALSYARKALQLERRYSWEGLDGVCYFQLGDYEKALTAYERAYADADSLLKQGPASRINYIREVMNDPVLRRDLQKLREQNEALLFFRMVIHHHH